MKTREVQVAPTSHPPQSGFDADLVHRITLTDLIDHIHAFNHLAEDGVVVVKMWLRAVTDIELATG